MRALHGHLVLAGTLALTLAACTDRSDARHPREGGDPAASATVVDPRLRGDDGSATAAAPSTVAAPSTIAASSTVATPPATGPMPAEGAITFLGFGPAHWGASEEQVRQAWGKELDASPGEPGGCHYLFPLPRSGTGLRLAFMIEAGRFGRLDVRAPDIAAPGGGRVGMDKAALHRLYPTASQQPHKYVEGGLNLRVADPAGGQGAVVFELDPAGKTTAWRVGVPPQVDYVEGCS